MTQPSTQIGFTQRCQQALDQARQIFETKPDWVTFFRKTVGSDGVARDIFDTPEDYAEFEKSKQFEEIQNMQSALRGEKPAKSSESTKVITVRLPESLHETLKAEAAQHKTSMNKLCISKLLMELQAAEDAEAEAANSRLKPADPEPPAQPQATTIPMDTHSRRKKKDPGFRSTFGSGPQGS